MLACWECRNLERFVQVSARGDARDVTQRAKAGIETGTWDRPDDRPVGIYCSSCERPIADADLSTLGLADDRIAFVDPASFDVEETASEILTLRPDATWTRFDLPAAPPRTAPAPALHPALLAALDRTNRLPLYTHQAAAVDAALAGANVVQATAAGSGKSIGLLFPALDACLRDEDASAIIVYPLRALANDQIASLGRLGITGTRWLDEAAVDLRLDEDAPALRIERYDGSALEHQRKRARQHARIVITTPDSLHQSLLRMADRQYSDGTSWSRLFRGLRYVVLDEIHSYGGVFGSAVAQVIRRLRRVCEDKGADPRFLAASATISNPVEVARRLTAATDWRLVDDDGAPRRARTVLICNPPPLGQGTPPGQGAPPDTGESQGHVSPQTMAIDLIAGSALASDRHAPIRTICFGRSRLEVFALTKRLQGRLKELRASELASAVSPYAATLLDSDRVTAEGKLRDGRTLAVVATNALELGIDIPDLSLAVLCGYPGQISSFRQRAGRVGRAGEGLVVLIVGDDPLQQFIANDPDALRSLLAGRPEEVVLNPDAPEIVRRFGLAPAQAELGGIAYEDRRWFGDAVEAWLENASGAPSTRRKDVAYWTVPTELEAYAPLRSSTGGDSYTVVAVADGARRPIGTIDAATAPRDAFVPAIWNDAEHSYRVVGLDHAARNVLCEGPIEASHLTRGVPVDAVAVTSELEPLRDLGTATVGYGELAVSRQVFSYKVISLSGGERTEPVETPRWPPVEFVTEGVHLSLDHDWMRAGAWDPDEAVKGLEHVLLSLAPVVVACDPNDLDATSDGMRVYLYDSFGPGIGITRVAFHRFDEIVAYAVRLVHSCPCATGCPSCVLLSRRPDGNRGVSKAGALHLLERLHAAS